MPWFQDRWEALSKKSRIALEVLFGLILAAAGSYFLFRPSASESETSFISTAIAVGVVLLGPNVLETQTGNKMPLMRKVMLAALALGLAIIFGRMLLEKNIF